VDLCAVAPLAAGMPPGTSGKMPDATSLGQPPPDFGIRVEYALEPPYVGCYFFNGLLSAEPGQCVEFCELFVRKGGADGLMRRSFINAARVIGSDT